MELPEIESGDVGREVSQSGKAFPRWRASSLETRRSALADARSQLQERQEELAQLISLEVGKPLREARLEMAAVIAKFDLTFADAERHVADRVVADGPHPALIRHRARGPAAVIAPYNFPIHLGHGAVVAYLLAGNTVLFKPSPLAANIGAAYARVMQACLPGGVFHLVQGGGGDWSGALSASRGASRVFHGLGTGRAFARDGTRAGLLEIPRFGARRKKQSFRVGGRRS